MGMIIANEKSVKKADSTLKKIFNARYFLYGAINRLANNKKSFIVQNVVVTFCKDKYN